MLPLLLLLMSGTAFAQDDGAWRALSGPVAFVTHLASDPDSPGFLFIFVSNSVQRNPDQTQTTQGQPNVSWAPYFSTDNGEYWYPASNDLAGFEPTALKIVNNGNGAVIWVGTAANGLWRSENGGRTWRPAVIPSLVDQRVVGIVQDARQRLQLLTVDNGRYPATHLYTSPDGGVTWQHRQIAAYQDDPAAAVSAIIADPFDGNRLYITTHGGLLLTENAGFDWRRMTLPLPDDASPQGGVVLAADATQRGRLYVVRRTQLGDGQRVLLSFLSLDGGLTWQRQPATFTAVSGANPNAEPTPVSLAVDPMLRRRLLLTTDCGLWLSPDGGISWRAAGTALAGVSLSGMVFQAREKGGWIAAGAGGIWRTDSAGSIWESITAGLPAASSIHQLLALDDNTKTLLALNGGFFPAATLRQPLWRSVDGGQSWLPARRGLEGVHVRQLIAYPAEKTTAFALTDQGLARTDNSGVSWLHRQLDVYPVALAADPATPRLYLATATGLRRSEDKGDSWTLVQNGSVIAVTVDAAGSVFSAVYDESGALALWRSDDAGEHWTQIGPLPVAGAISLAAHPHQARLLTLIAPWEGLFVSVDGGRSWERRVQGIPVAARWSGASPQLPNAPNILTLFMDAQSGEWWASRDGGGVYRSLNNGALWQDVTGDLGDTMALAFARGQSLLAGTSNLGVIHYLDVPSKTTPPADIDARIEIFWPHDFAPPASAKLANLGLRLYKDHSLEPPPCAWSPNVMVWAARDAEPLRQLDVADHRNVDGHPFPFWMLNDIDVTWANDANHQLIYMAKVAPGLAQTSASVWIHAADARTRLPDPPKPVGVAAAGVKEIDGRILLVWPHDAAGRYAPPDQAPLANVSAVLFQRDSLLALAPDDLPNRVWLIGALDNQIGRSLAIGTPRIVTENGVRYTIYDFNDIDVSLARSAAHHWAFWLEAPDADLTSNVWVHGSDARTIAPHVVEPIVGCQP